MSINTDWRISWKNSPKAQFFNWIRSYQSSHTFDQKINLLPSQILQTCTCIFVYRITHHARIDFFSKGGFRKITVCRVCVWGGGDGVGWAGGGGPRHICDKLTM